MNCQVCQLNPSKYKCPTCRLKYCSVVCFKTHSLVHSSAPTSIVSESVNAISESNKIPLAPLTNVHVHDNPLPTSQLKLNPDNGLEPRILETLHSSKMADLIRDKSLQKMLSVVDSSDNPEASLEKYASHPLFAEFYNQIADSLSK